MLSPYTTALQSMLAPELALTTTRFQRNGHSYQRTSMARDDRDAHRRVAGRIQIESQAHRGILVLHRQQPSVDRMGMARRSVCAHRSAGRAVRAERARREEERSGDLI